MISLILAVPILFVLSGYYRRTAEEFNKSTIGYTLLGFFMPFLPFILFVLFIALGHLLLGHDPKFKINRSLLFFGMFAYLILVLALPQYLKSKWQSEKNLLDADDILDAPSE